MMSQDQVPGALPSNSGGNISNSSTISASRAHGDHSSYENQSHNPITKMEHSAERHFAGPGHIHHSENDPIVPASGMGGNDYEQSGYQSQGQKFGGNNDSYGDQSRAEFARGDSKMLSNPSQQSSGNTGYIPQQHQQQPSSAGFPEHTHSHTRSGFPEQQQYNNNNNSHSGSTPTIVNTTSASGTTYPSQQSQGGFSQSSQQEQQPILSNQQQQQQQGEYNNTTSTVGRSNTTLGTVPAKKESSAPHIDTKTPALDKLHLMGKLVDSLGVCMMTTRCPDTGILTSRPMQIRHRDLTDLYFLTSLHSPKLLDLSRDNHVNISFLHESSGEWCSLNGNAEIIRWSDCAGPQCSHRDESTSHGRVHRRLSKDILNKLWTPNIMHWSSNVASTTTNHQHSSKSTHRAPEGVQSDLAIIYVHALSVHYGSASSGFKNALKRAVGGTPKGNDLIVREITNEEIDAARLVLNHHEE